MTMSETADQPREITDDEMLDWIRAFEAEFGVTPAYADAVAWPGPKAPLYYKRFGTWTDAVREAGLEPRGAVYE
jgi:hypothetical protein